MINPNQAIETCLTGSYYVIFLSYDQLVDIDSILQFIECFIRWSGHRMQEKLP
jgi:hypothetical protein